MARIRSFFALPPERVDEIRALLQEWGEAVDARRDDKSVLANRLYGRMDEVALHRVSLEGDAQATAGLAAWSHLTHVYPRWSDRTVLGPEECVELAETLAALEARYASEEVLHMRVRRHKIGGEPSLEDIAVAYAAFSGMVEWAVAHGAGFATATYWPGAEERLDEKRREDEERRVTAANAPRSSPEEEAALTTGLQQEVAHMVEEERQRQWASERANQREFIGSTQRELYLVPAGSVEEIHALVLASQRGGDTHMDALRSRAAGCALEQLAFAGRHERYALEQLLSIALREDHLPRRGGARLLPLDKVLEMDENLSEWWREFQPMARAMEVLSILSDDAPHDACERAYRGFSELLARARERRESDAGAALLTVLAM